MNNYEGTVHSFYGQPLEWRPNIVAVYVLFIVLAAMMIFPTPSRCQRLPRSKRSIASVADNQALTTIFNIDQNARVGPHIDWAKLAKSDEERRRDVRQLLSLGLARTANDYFHAAMIFQHGNDANDYLMAHVLAMDAVALGSKPARWLSAATLDRYLSSIERPQIFGTQFHDVPESGNVVQDELNTTLLSDPMRSVLCVVSSSEQMRIRDIARNTGTLGTTQLTNRQCK